MRRKDREVTAFEDILAIIKDCDVCRIALNDQGYPYIVPLNFGMKAEGETIELYFHGAMEGRKYDLIRKDNRVAFEMDCAHRLVTEMEHGNCTMEYKCVIGRGHIEIIPDEEKYEALCILMEQYHQESFPFNKAIMPKTTVFKLTVEQISGKVNQRTR